MQRTHPCPAPRRISLHLVILMTVSEAETHPSQDINRSQADAVEAQLAKGIVVLMAASWSLCFLCYSLLQLGIS